MASIKINGVGYAVRTDPQKPLLWFLREDLGLNGAKYGCGIGLCGTCTVLLDGEPVKSCQVTVEEITGKEVTTIEGLDDELGQKVKAAWIETEASQCGFCQPGQVLTAAHLLRTTPQPTDTQIDESMTTLCRCGAYQRIRAAVHAAAKPEE